VSSITNLMEADTNASARAPVTNQALPSPAVALKVPPGTPEQTVQFTNDKARYTFTSHGGGLKLVELLEYPQDVGCNRGGRDGALASLNTAAPVPVMTLLGGEAVEGDGLFTLTRTAAGVRVEKVLSNGLALVKEFLPTSNYMLTATLRLENRSPQPLALPGQQWVVGTATPMGPQDDETLVGFYWFDGQRDYKESQTWFANPTLGCACLPGTPRSQYVNGASNIAWTAVHNQFFTLAVMPPTNAQPERLVVDRIDLPPFPPAEGNRRQKAPAKPFGFQASMLYPATVLAPNQVLERQFHLFAGPREYKTLATLGAHYKNDLDRVMGYGGFFGFFAKILLLSMNGLHGLGLGYALCIIGITLIIKILFWPLTQASTRSMKRMQELQPQMKAIQAKFKDDPAKMQRKMMEFMKENKVNPMGGCVPMLVQIPIFIGFYQMIQSAIELRGARFLWACDLSQPDTVFFLPGLGFPVNPLPLIMGATMLWQSRLTPVSPGVDPMQQKMMKYMPLMFLFILYNFSAGLTLYWTVQNLLTIAQMKLTKPKPIAAPTPAAAAAPPSKKRKR
jgi:YidC/Oxa1 family membrane protein insertase